LRLKFYSFSPELDIRRIGAIKTAMKLW